MASLSDKYRNSLNIFATDEELNNIDLSKNFPFLSICDYSISEHICGGGVNGMIVPEGQTFVCSPTWNNKYLKENPRNANQN